MRIIHSLFLIILTTTILKAQIIVTEVGTLPEKVSNNAVCEGFVNNVPHVFSFGGIDSTKLYSGIHLKSYRYNIQTGIANQIADLPDTRGKIGVGASRIGNIIYIAGGYQVFQNGSEISSNKMHRYDIDNNVYLTDAANIPVATDDHVQAVWRDSLIFLITGWSNSGNIPNTQIYNPVSDSWVAGTSVPNTSAYKSFGASGTIVNDTIFYFGGANSSSGTFSIQNQLRKGVINPTDPTQITWTISTPNPIINGYRTACTVWNNAPCWIGGSNTTYNYNGIAYNGTGGVPPSKKVLCLTPDHQNWNEFTNIDIPMDLRGITSIDDKVKYLAGGMLSNQTVTNKIFKLEWDTSTSNSHSIEQRVLNVYPNPFTDKLYIENVFQNVTIYLFNPLGQLIMEQEIEANQEISLESIQDGLYYLKVHQDGKTYSSNVFKKSW